MQHVRPALVHHYKPDPEG